MTTKRLTRPVVGIIGTNSYFEKSSSIVRKREENITNLKIKYYRNSLLCNDYPA